MKNSMISDKPSIYVLIAAAGEGQRLGGDIPKQYRALGGKTLLRRSVEAFARLEEVSSITVIIHEDARADYECALDGFDLPAPIMGGKTRQESVYNALKSLKSVAPSDLILIHDAARPFVDAQDIKALIDALKTAKAATLFAPVVDTLYDEKSNAYLERSALRALQTPQGFCYGTLMAAHEKFKGDTGCDFTDDTSLVAAMGEAICYVLGSKGNFKITTQDDMDTARKLIAADMVTRTGIGFDVHAFDDVPASAIRIGGIDIPYTRALKGHSDADVALHAMTDALLGAIAAGDIGDHFPPSDNAFKGMDSAIFLARAGEMLRERGGEIINIDLTVMCEAPKLGAYKASMAVRIAEILDLKVDQIGVKATTTEKLGFTGRGEGIAAQAVANVRIPA